MEKLHTVDELVSKREELDHKGLKVGFVPTMGALHEGHISLVKKSVSENDITIVSIFVNPKQFNDKSDFENYPVDYDNDLALLESVNCDYVFMPDGKDVYNDYNGVSIDFNGLDKILEGEFRLGHFQGVVDVVYRLFDLVKPYNSYFGQKDFQQLAVIKKLVEYKGLDINVVGCDIVREKHGLAMSSRNERLTSTQRNDASSIIELMKKFSSRMKIGDSTEEFSNYFMTEMKKISEMRPEYCVFCHPESLEEIKIIEENSVIVMCGGVWCGGVRLIDNIILEF